MKKSTLIRQDFELFARNNSGKTLTTKEINNGVESALQSKYGFGLSGWCVSDFAEPETLHERSKYNKTLFYRIKIGVYKVL